MYYSCKELQDFNRQSMRDLTQTARNSKHWRAKKALGLRYFEGSGGTRQNFDEAKKLFKKVVKTEHDHDSYFLLGELAQKDHRYFNNNSYMKKAVRYYMEAARGNDANPAAAIRLAEFAAKNNNIIGAYAWLTQALICWPHHNHDLAEGSQDCLVNGFNQVLKAVLLKDTDALEHINENNLIDDNFQSPDSSKQGALFHTMCATGLSRSPNSRELFNKLNVPFDIYSKANEENNLNQAYQLNKEVTTLFMARTAREGILPKNNFKEFFDCHADTLGSDAPDLHNNLYGVLSQKHFDWNQTKTNFSAYVKSVIDL